MEIANHIISVLSLIATIAISVVIYKLERRNQKITREKEVKEEAKRFIIDNSGEIEYLHLAIVAVGCYPQNKHVKKIYNNFAYLDDEVKQEVLRQRKLNCELINGDKWIYEKINMIKNAIHELDIGDDFLYDNGKYFTRSYNYKREPLIDYKKDCFVYNDFFHMRDMFPNNHGGMLTYEQYLEDYLYFKFEKDEETQKKKTILKPNDYLINVEELMRREEKKVCYWIMIMVENVIRFSIRYLNYKMKEHDSTDAIFSTYEDKYFSILYDLYYLQKNE